MTSSLEKPQRCTYVEHQIQRSHRIPGDDDDYGDYDNENESHEIIKDRIIRIKRCTQPALHHLTLTGTEDNEKFLCENHYQQFKK